ncbi:MAG TPA: TonB-dependent receptor [Acidobacteriaceae bacterium]|nr:TonB-dependent receptor [Acidobacteriaceae bacterium]
MHTFRRLFQEFSFVGIAIAIALVCGFLAGGSAAFGQTDQGTITGTITDPQGAVIPNAQVTLTNVETGLVLRRATNNSGMYVFSPVKIGTYSITVTAPGFETVTQSNLVLNVNQTLESNLKLRTGSVSQTVTVQGGAAQLMQTEEASTGQVMSSAVINETPLALRNYVFIAQLAAGVTEAQGSRGQGRGDFNANGLRAEQNNFILDGVDNNSNQVDFLNGASYVVKPPPDALAEFKVQTGDYDAEFGHSAGAVVNAAIKSGTNQIHGDLWEYIRNTDLGVARDYFNRAPQKQPGYHQNQFGGTLGGPFWKNKLFWFADIEALRVVSPSTGTYTVPTALMRQGNFSELLNTNLTGQSKPTTLYEPGSGGATLLTCNGQQNVLCPNQIDPLAQKILNLYPQPNNGVPGQTYNNYIVNTSTGDNTVSWDARLDWDPSQKDQAFFRASYYNERGTYNPPLGFILDGGGYGGDGAFVNMGENYDLSETHEFSSNLINSFRFGYNWGHPEWVPLSYKTNVSAQVGLGGIPYTPGNGGLPSTSISGLSGIGGPQWYPAIEFENVFQIVDDLTKVVGKHTIKAGIDFEHVRVATTAPVAPHGTYSFSGFYTGAPGVSFTGSGAADLLADNVVPPGSPAGTTPGSMNSAGLTAFFNIDNTRWYKAGYIQDSWKLSPRLTINYGLRYEYFQPVEERHDHQALWYPTATAPGHGTANYVMANSQQSDYLAPGFLKLLAKDNINLMYTANRSLVHSQYSQLAPRAGIAWQLSNRLVARTGYGLFYGGLESIGGAPNLGYSYPFQYSVNFPRTTCKPNNCPSIGQLYGINLANGFSTQPGWDNGLAKDPNPSTPSLIGAQPFYHTPYTQQWNLSFEYALSNTMTWTIGYVGNNSRHLEGFPDQNARAGLVGPSDNGNNERPFPDFGGSQFDDHEGVSSYNSLQTTVQKHYANGLSFLADYTYGHALDDTQTPLNGGGNLYRMPLNLPMNSEYATSDWDVRQRVAFNGQYELPFGRGRKYLANSNTLVNELAGGWSTDVVFFTQTGLPTSIGPNNSGANGPNARRAFLVHDPFKAGGSPDPSNPGTTCASSTKNITHWYNPCAFANPLPGNTIPNTQTASNPVGNPITAPSAILPYVGPARNQIVGPGYERINMSLFKNFTTFESQYLQFRADAFNVFNTPAFNNPGNGINSNGGQITSTHNMGQFTPNSRFLQLALKYYF